jgi:N-acetyltransferase 10
MILDLVPSVARLYFTERLDLSLSYTQAAIFMALGLQHKSVTQLQVQLCIPTRMLAISFVSMC